MKIVGYLSTIIIAILFTFSAQAEEIKENSSDRRLMTNVVEMEVLENGMVIYDWVWNDAARRLDPKYGMPVEEGGYPSQGLIAQEIEAEYPDAVIEDSNGYLVIDIPVLADNDALIAQMVMEGGADVVKKKKKKRKKKAKAKKKKKKKKKKVAKKKKKKKKPKKKKVAKKKPNKSKNSSGASAGAISGTTSAPKKRVLSYRKEQSTEVRKCKKVMGKKFCIGPKGRIGAGVNGKMSIATIAKASTGELGALLSAKQIFTVKLFGRDVKIGAKCMFSSGAKTTFSHTFGASMSTPPIPSVSAGDILSAVASRGKSATKGAMRGARKTASIPKRGDANNPAGGYAGEATDSQFNKLMGAAASGCEVVVKPNPKVFKGIPAVNIYDIGVTIVMRAQNWKINQKTGKVSVKLVAMAFGKLKVGNEKVKVAGKKFKIPGFTFNKKIANLVSMGIST